MQPIKTYKLQGELVELRFLERATELGLRVSKPYGDSAPYDFLVESGGTVLQVKSTNFRAHKCRAYVCATHRQGSLYSRKDVDFIAAYIISEDAWYIIPMRAISGGEVSLNPRFRRNKYRRYREAWDLLIPERHNRRWFRKPKPSPAGAALDSPARECRENGRRSSESRRDGTIRGWPIFSAPTRRWVPEIAADVTKYGDNGQRALFIVYDPNHVITNEEDFGAQVNRREEMRLVIIR